MTEGDRSEGFGGAGPAAGGPAPVADVSRSVFMSYASADLAVATLVCDALERAGITCWIAPRDVMGGDLYADSIVRAINTSRQLGANAVSRHSPAAANSEAVIGPLRP